MNNNIYIEMNSLKFLKFFLLLFIFVSCINVKKKRYCIIFISKKKKAIIDYNKYTTIKKKK